MERKINKKKKKKRKRKIGPKKKKNKGKDRCRVKAILTFQNLFIRLFLLMIKEKLSNLQRKTSEDL